jgi:beta-lactamase regulating signal transducer with metallopeptidase domain
MIIYLLKSASCLALLLVFYYLVLEREKMHNFNRFYLLGSVFFSFLAPLYIIHIEATPIIFEAAENTIVFHSTEIGTTKIIPEKPFNCFSILIGLYSLISFILLFRFGKNLFNIIQKTKNNSKIKYQKAVLVLVDDKILPHTFWNFIFINKKEYEEKKIEQELFTHELTHVTQKHTLDILILEFIQCLFWINPFIIILKKSVQLNHEFLADETVINKHKNIFQYQHLLLNKAAWNNKYYLASNLNYSLTKKRLKMMTTESSSNIVFLKKLAIIPLLTGFIFLFAERVEAQKVIK